MLHVTIHACVHAGCRVDRRAGVCRQASTQADADRRGETGADTEAQANTCREAGPGKGRAGTQTPARHPAIAVADRQAGDAAQGTAKAAPGRCAEAGPCAWHCGQHAGWPDGHGQDLDRQDHHI